MTPEWAEVWEAALAASRSAVAGPLPGRVVSYDAATQRAKVQPAIRRPVPTREPGVFTFETPPPIPNVLVLWPRGGGHAESFTLTAGDGVLLIPCQYDPSPFLASGEVSDPVDVRASSLAHCVAIPGCASSPLGDVGTVTPKATVGGDTDAAALASKVDLIGRVIAQIPVATGTGVAADVVAKLNLVLTAFQAVYEGPTPAPPGGTVGSAVLKLGS